MPETPQSQQPWNGCGDEGRGDAEGNLKILTSVQTPPVPSSHGKAAGEAVCPRESRWWPGSEEGACVPVRTLQDLQSAQVFLSLPGSAWSL